MVDKYRHCRPKIDDDNDLMMWPLVRGVGCHKIGGAGAIDIYGKKNEHLLYPEGTNQTIIMFPQMIVILREYSRRLR
jgi:hypothetical protein